MNTSDLAGFLDSYAGGTSFPKPDLVFRSNKLSPTIFIASHRLPIIYPTRPLTSERGEAGQGFAMGINSERVQVDKK
jgi:hypothetical protein